MKITSVSVKAILIAIAVLAVWFILPKQVEATEHQQIKTQVAQPLNDETLKDDEDENIIVIDGVTLIEEPANARGR